MNTSSVDPGDADNGQTTLRLYFAKGPTLRTWADRVGWKWLLKHPLTLWEILGTEFIGWAWKSDARHVLIGQLGGVLDYQYCRVIFYPQDSFEDQYPNLLGYFEIPHDKWCNLQWYADQQTEAPHWRKALVTSLKYYGMFFTAGLYRPRTCVTVASEVLADADIEVPKKCWAPPRLAWWLLEEGYGFIPTGTAPKR